jgi:hypothetical protein
MHIVATLLGSMSYPEITNKDEDYSLRANTLAYFDGAFKVKEKKFYCIRHLRPGPMLRNFFVSNLRIFVVI